MQFCPLCIVLAIIFFSNVSFQFFPGMTFVEKGVVSYGIRFKIIFYVIDYLQITFGTGVYVGVCLSQNYEVIIVNVVYKCMCVL